MERKTTGIKECENFRKVEKLNGKKWVIMEFKNLKQHNEFRFYNCDGTVYKAITDPYICDSKGVLKIDVV
jgi:hypothetical protein